MILWETELSKMKLQRVGDYLLGEKLGEGSFAKVRVGLHVMSREKVSRSFCICILFIRERVTSSFVCSAD